MSEWESSSLLELAVDEKSAISKPYGSAIVRSDYVEEGVPVVRGANLAGWKFIDEGFVFISEEHAARMPGARLQAGDLVFTHRGSVGQVAMVPRVNRFGRYTLSTSQVKARLDPTRALPEFYEYWFRSRQGRESILAGLSTVGVPGLARPVETVKALRVPVPALAEQQRIAAVLGAFDGLIEASRALSADLEKVWRLILRKATETLGSVTTPLSSIAEFVNGKNFTKESGAVGRPVARTPEVRSGPSESTLRNAVAAQPSNVAKPGDVLFVWSGSLMVSRWEWEEALVNQHIFKVIPKQDMPRWVVLYGVESLMNDFLGLAESQATTMGHIKRADLDRKTTLPAPETLVGLDATVGPMFDMALTLRLEAHELARIRDELLSLLMSGRVRVAEAEEALASLTPEVREVS